jgi:hypothetical protein
MKRFLKSLSVGVAMKAEWYRMVLAKASPAVRHAAMVKYMREVL